MELCAFGITQVIRAWLCACRSQALPTGEGFHLTLAGYSLTNGLRSRLPLAGNWLVAGAPVFTSWPPAGLWSEISQLATSHYERST